MSVFEHTFELESVQQACLDLISENAEHLIRHIYTNSNRAPYNDPRIRVGLALKTLLRSSDSSDTVIVNSEAVNPVIFDLTELMSKASSSVERRMLTDELTFLERCTQLEELVSLNTVRQ
jgi:hypothetical protein